eukprot:1195890-Prorocentrum_minimum.AAC.4
MYQAGPEHSSESRLTLSTGRCPGVAGFGTTGCWLGRDGRIRRHAAHGVRQFGAAHFGSLQPVPRYGGAHERGRGATGVRVRPRGARAGGGHRLVSETIPRQTLDKP